MSVCIIDCPNTAALLFQVPAPNGLIVGSREQEFAPGMEDQRADPIVVTGLNPD